MKTIKGVMPLKFKYKIQEYENKNNETMYIDFLDNYGDTYTDKIRYRYYVDAMDLIFFPIGWEDNNTHHHRILRPRKFNMKRITNAVYKHHNKQFK